VCGDLLNAGIHGARKSRYVERTIAIAKANAAAVFLTAIWELNLQQPGFRSIEDLISPHGQELAPWHMDQVAVASQGLSPRPLWISAGGKPAKES